MTTTENSRADALTAQAALAAIETFEIVGENNDSREPNAEDRFILTEFIAHAFGGYPVEQPAAAPIDATRDCCPHGIHWDNACGACVPPRGTSVSAPADERAACEAAWNKRYSCVVSFEGFGAEYHRGWMDRAASASETAAEGVKLPRYAPGIALDKVRGGDVAVMYSRDDGEYVKLSDVLRSPAMAAEAVAWVRKHPDTGELSGDWLWNDVIEQCRKDSGVWFPVGFLGTPPASPAEAVAIPAEVIAWRDAWQAYIDATDTYNAHLKYVRANCPFGTSVDTQFQAMNNAQRAAMALLKPMHAALSGSVPAPQPADADAREGLSDELVDTLKLAIGYIGSSIREDRHEHIARIRTLLQGANHA